MFYNVQGGIPTVNCQPQADSDVCGIGVRCALYIQAALSLLLPRQQTDLSTVFNTNFLLQITSMSLVLAVLFDSKINVPNAIIATHLAVLLSTCRLKVRATWPLDLDNLRRLNIKLWFMNLATDLPLTACNLGVWVDIRKLQSSVSFCPDGAGDWVFFGNTYSITIATTASNFVFGFVIYSVVHELLDCAAGGARLVHCSRRGWINLEPHDVEFDTVVWWIRTLLQRRMKIGWRRLHTRMNYVRMCHKWFTLAYVIWTVEQTVNANAFASVDNSFGFGQISALFLALTSIIHSLILGHTSWFTCRKSFFIRSQS